MIREAPEAPKFVVFRDGTLTDLCNIEKQRSIDFGGYQSITNGSFLVGIVFVDCLFPISLYI